MDEAQAAVEHLLDDRADRALELRPAPHHRPVVRLDPELVERLDVVEGLEDGLASRDVCAWMVASSPPSCMPTSASDVAGEEQLLPVAPRSWRLRDRERAALLVDVEHAGHGAGDEPAQRARAPAPR